jgi:hypothetical protein
MFNPHNPQTADLPFSPGPINWLEPLAFKFNQLRDVSAAAERAGFRIFRLKVVPGGYEAMFARNPVIAAPQGRPDGTAGGLGGGCPPEKSKESFLRP